LLSLVFAVYPIVAWKAWQHRCNASKWEFCPRKNTWNYIWKKSRKTKQSPSRTKTPLVLANTSPTICW